MELERYTAIAKKWVWLAVVAAAIAAGTSYYYSRTIPPTYQASSTLLVGRVIQEANPSAASLAVASSLVQAHALLATQPPVLQGAAQALHWRGAWQDLYFLVSVQTPGGQLLVISARNSDPKVAADLANEVARQVVLLSPTSAAQRQSEEQATFVSGQLKQLTTQIETAEKSLNDLNTQATIETDGAKLTELRNRIDALQTKIDGWQKNYTTLSALLNNSTNNYLSVLTPAVQPTSPVSPNIPLNVLLGGLAGLLLAAAAAFVFEFLDDTIKETDDVQRSLGVTALGSISRMPSIRQPGDSLITLKSPRAPSAEAYRVLRTNIRLSGIKSTSAAILVTSATAGEGKTTTAANLAVTMAQIGKRVVLVDTDLRRPNVHKFFGLNNDFGLTTLFLGDQAARDSRSAVQDTEVDGLHVLTSGPIPPNPAELLDSARMGEIIEDLRGDYDLTILDSPPALAFADAAIIGSRCGSAIVVIDGGKTRTGATRRALKILTQAKIKVIGAVVNKLNPDPALNKYYANY